jgi:aminopeptidase N
LIKTLSCNPQGSVSFFLRIMKKARSKSGNSVSPWAKWIIVPVLLTHVMAAMAQTYTRADTLRGSLRHARTCFDVTYYSLSVEPNLDDRSISGVCSIDFLVTEPTDSIQIDLFPNMKIGEIKGDKGKLTFRREAGAVFVQLGRSYKKGDRSRITVRYNGTPMAAKNPPWDGGFVWRKDKQGRPFIGVACEGIGASLWWPNKDHLSDEPDSMTVAITVPKGLYAKGNGHLSRIITAGADKHTFVWKVSHPINNYNVTLNIGNYVDFVIPYVRKEGDTLNMRFHVLDYDLEKAKTHFAQSVGMMRCFEESFGPYPFPRDGYSLVQTPYLGMEHQGAIAYGNDYLPGYKGMHAKGIDFDFILIHETGHEWWGNSVSMDDVAHMWIHEGFCTYAEALYVECTLGYDVMLRYLEYQRPNITNKNPIMGKVGLNAEGDGTDMYYKGSWMLHTIRSVMDNDSLFKAMVKGVATEFRHKQIDSKTVIEYCCRFSGRDLRPIFKQYLEQTSLPRLEYRLEGKKTLAFRWVGVAPDFKMPVDLEVKGKRIRLEPTTTEQTYQSPRPLKKMRICTDRFLIDSSKPLDK